MIGELSPWHLLILAAVILVLFGAKKLPDSARSLGRAMRIFKSETSSLRGDHSGDHSGEDDAKPQAAAPQQLAAPQQVRTAETAGAASAPQPEAQHSNQPG
ncbi:MAG TPA: Sec-independent protein translocase subunit TatA [Streptosporangiaceae bacterium]|jgi:sec-independent protein translocase protein TatA|nr:Sec-independent protein translocase subunit TatA [Streptosporangiaceae bacterium]